MLARDSNGAESLDDGNTFGELHRSRRDLTQIIIHFRSFCAHIRGNKIIRSAPNEEKIDGLSSGVSLSTMTRVLSVS